MKFSEMQLISSLATMSTHHFRHVPILGTTEQVLYVLDRPRARVIQVSAGFENKERRKITSIHMPIASRTRAMRLAIDGNLNGLGHMCPSFGTVWSESVHHSFSAQ